jgi:ribosomal protein L29
MIESPLLQRLIGSKLQEAVQDVLKARFRAVPRDVARLLGDILNEKKLRKLNVFAAKCPDLEAFREALLA